MSTIIVPTPLRKFTDNEGKVEVKANNVYEAIKALAAKYPPLSVHLFDEDEKLRKFVRIYLGDEDINVLQREETPIEEQSQISIIPAIAGGKI